MGTFSTYFQDSWVSAGQTLEETEFLTGPGISTFGIEAADNEMSTVYVNKNGAGYRSIPAHLQRCHSFGDTEQRVTGHLETVTVINTVRRSNMGGGSHLVALLKTATLE